MSDVPIPPLKYPLPLGVIVEAWEGQKKEASKMFDYLKSRPLHKDPVVTLKSFILIHKLIQSGPPEVKSNGHIFCNG